MQRSNKQLIVIAGPTAVGKTDLSIEVARSLQTVILSADSRQFYCELDVGVAKPNATQLSSVPHHFINSNSIAQLYSAGDFERDALVLLSKIFKTHDHVVLTGGSGLYIKAICDGLDDLPQPIEGLRENLEARLQVVGVEPLRAELMEIDPDFFQFSDPQNTRRMLRALEVYHTTGQPYSSFLKRDVAKRPFEIIQIALQRPRDELYQRINQRCDQMLADGLIEETKSLVAFRRQNSLQTVGYKEVFDFLDGHTDYNEMVRLFKQNTRRYAKRQMTWFRNQGNFKWFSADDLNGVLAHIQSYSSL